MLSLNFMEIYMEDHQIKYRYERKYLIPEVYLIKLTNAIYKQNYYPVYPDRMINNIYFDNYDLSSVKENIEGLSKRKKYRIRWYGDTYKRSKKILEVKIKNEFVNRKLNIPLSNIKLDNLEEIDVFSNEIKNNLIELKQYKQFNELNSRIPTLLNFYKRSYFGDIKKEIRITIDKELYFYSPITKLKSREKLIVVEAKYNKDYSFDNYFNNFNFTRYSKYVKGILQTTTFNPSY